MIPPDICRQLLDISCNDRNETQATLQGVGFKTPSAALARLQQLCRHDNDRHWLACSLPTLLYFLSEAADPDDSLVNFERYVLAVNDRTALFADLAQKPRAIEMLVKLFVGSQFLTDILIRDPQLLTALTNNKRLAEFKSRDEFIVHGRQFSQRENSHSDRVDTLRHYQQSELLRIAACDKFGFMDLRSTTLQLSLLADALVQLTLEEIAKAEGIDPEGFAVLAFGKLGGEELNYSSDIDLVFACRSGPQRFQRLAQQLVRCLSEVTPTGFLYRVDMRLRPWGSAGALVTSAEAYLDYAMRHAGLWEKQALLKARPIAGDHALGQQLLQDLEPLIYEVDRNQVRENIRQRKEQLEVHLQQQGQHWGEVKSGPGGIRDIEFVTQYLQQTHGREIPAIRCRNTLEALVRLAEADLLTSEEYRRLSSGYLVLRTVEHSLQLLHNKQEHSLPREPRALNYLARRLDYPNAETFVRHLNHHCRTVRKIFWRHLITADDGADDSRPVDALGVADHLGQAVSLYREAFSDHNVRRHLALLNSLTPDNPVAIRAVAVDEYAWELTLAGYDMLGDLSMICGLLFAGGFNIESGYALTGAEVGEVSKFVNVFRVSPRNDKLPSGSEYWDEYLQELRDLMRIAQAGRSREWQGRLVRRVAAAFNGLPEQLLTLLPVEIEIDNDSNPQATVLHLSGEDTPGFLYELTNALTTTGISIRRMAVHTQDRQAIDTLHVVDRTGEKIVDQERLRELRAAIVLIKHFTHLLPRSPNPEAALIHFQEFVEQQLARRDWVQPLTSLQDSHVLDALARLLGVSDFLWEDFLKMQHENLFPVLTDVAALRNQRTQLQLRADLAAVLANSPPNDRITRLNAFKDREMLRVDMRHILGLQDTFVMFSQELTVLAEVVVESALDVCRSELEPIHGSPSLGGGRTSKLAICGLGKFGGKELGFASDIELMFIYDADGHTPGPQVISNAEYYRRLIERFRHAIVARRKGIFEVDLRLRPFGQAGNLAVSLASFESYFGPEGPAWPYERQALVKLRPVAGDPEFCHTIQQLRDNLVYRGESFDVAAMRALREKQVRQLATAGRFNAKLSPGGLVDCEYLVQGLQISFGHLHPSLRHPNTREAMKALEQQGILTRDDRRRLRDCYRFLRRLIDALRMVRGDASDLTVPLPGTDQFEFLARRLGSQSPTHLLQLELEQCAVTVLELNRLLDQPAAVRDVR